MSRHRTVWFAMIDGEQNGPMSRAEFAQRLAADVVDEETYVWKEGMREWLPASQVQDLATMFESREQARRHGVRPPPPPAAATAKAKPRPSAKESEEEIELELDVGALDPAMPHPAASAKGPPAAVSASSASAAPAQEPPEKFKLRPNSLASVKTRTGPKPRHTEAAPGAQIAPPSKSRDDDDLSQRTHVEMLPLGERVHQDEVAQKLFDPSDLPRPGKTGTYAIDSLKWTYSRTKKESKSDATKAAALLKAMQSTRAAARPVEPVQPEPVHPAESLELAVPVVHPAQPAKALQPAAAVDVRRPLPRQSQGRNAAILALLVVGGLLLGATVFFLLRLLLHF